MWLANSKRQPCFYPPQSHAQEDIQNRQKTDKPDGKPVLCQRTFSSVFRAVFFLTAQLNLERVGTYRRFRDRLRLHHQDCDGNRDAVPEKSTYFNNLTKASAREDFV